MPTQQQGRSAIVAPLGKESWPKESIEFRNINAARDEARKLARNTNTPIAVYKPVEIFVPKGEEKNFDDLMKDETQHSQSDMDSLNPKVTFLS